MKDKINNLLDLNNIVRFCVEIFVARSIILKQIIVSLFICCRMIRIQAFGCQTSNRELISKQARNHSSPKCLFKTFFTNIFPRIKSPCAGISVSVCQLFCPDMKDAISSKLFFCSDFIIRFKKKGRKI